MADFDINKLKFVIIQMKLPIAFDVLNSIKKEDNGKPYLIKIKDITASIRFNRIFDNRYNPGNINVTENVRIHEDRFSLLSYSEVQVWFDSSIVNKFDIKKDKVILSLETFFVASIVFINKFISLYRSITGQYWVRQIVRADIFGYDYILLDEYNNQSHAKASAVGGICTFNKKKLLEIDSEKDNKLRFDLVGEYYGFRLDIANLMLDNFFLGRYNLALVQSAILFENFIYSSLEKTLSKTKLNKIKRKSGCGCLSGISEVCENGIKEYFSFDFGSTQEWDNIKNKMLKLRNKIIHGEIIEEINQEQCDEALQAVRLGQDLLRNEVFNKEIKK